MAQENTSPTRETTLLLGVDHPTAGDVALRTQRDGATVCALCVGGESTSPARAAKGRDDVPNEDAVLAIDDGPRTLLAVADAHWGHESSHDLLDRLSRSALPLPTNPIELARRIVGLAFDDGTADYTSETTLLVAVWDRERASGFGLSFGDSSLVVVGVAHDPAPANRKGMGYVTPLRPASLEPMRGHLFEFVAPPGELIVVFSDGVDECHYRSPETLIRPRDLQNLLIRTGDGPGDYCQGLMELALHGVGGNPGGEDNIAIAVTRS